MVCGIALVYISLMTLGADSMRGLIGKSMYFCDAAFKSFFFLPVFLAPQNLYSYEIDFHTGVCEISEYGTPLSTWVFKNNNFFCFFVVFL